MSESPLPLRTHHWVWTALLFLAVFVPLAATINDPGEIWDEPVYLMAVEKALSWFGELFSATGDPFSRESLHEHWVYGRFGIVFHPPGGGYPAMLTHAFCNAWCSPRTSARWATALQLAGAAALAFHFLSRRIGRAGGLFAAFALVTMPRVFGEGHLFATDVPAMFWWALSAILFWKSLEQGTWKVRVGFALALAYAFLVKPTAVMVLLPIAAWSAIAWAWSLRSPEGRPEQLREAFRGLGLAAGLGAPLVVAGIVMLFLAGGMQSATERTIIDSMNEQFAGSDLSREQKETLIRSEMVRWLASVDLLEAGAESPAGGAGLILFPAVLWVLRALWIRSKRAPAAIRYGGNLMESLLAALAWSPAFVWILGPCWWTDTLIRMAHYLSLNFQRQGALPDIEIVYWGQKYVYTLPWHNGWVMLAITLPLGTLAMFVGGGIVAALGKTPNEPSLGRFLLINALTLPVLRMLGVPAHDGVRLMMPTMFFIAALAGIGFAWIAARCAALPRPRQWAVLIPMAALLLAPGVYGIAWSHPYELSYYNAMVGELAGAQRHGFEVTYWYDPVNRAALERIRETLPAGSTLQHHQHVDVFSDWEAEVLGPKVRTTAQAPAAQTYVGLLTHGSKSNPTMRLMWGMKPELVAARLQDVPLYSVYAPETVARATALTMLIRASSEQTAPSGPAMTPAGYSRDVIALAREQGDVLREAARLLGQAIAEPQPKAAETLTKSLDAASPEVRRAMQTILGQRLERFTSFRQFLSPHLAAFPQAMEEAAAILVARPDMVTRLVTAGYYPPDKEIAPYLDAEVAIDQRVK